MPESSDSSSCATEKEEMLETWYRRLSRPGAREIADQDNLASRIKELELMEAGYAALLWLAQHYEMTPLQALEAIRAKQERTAAESEALAAWDRIKDRQVVRD